jgi:hypothetical protein
MAAISVSTELTTRPVSISSVLPVRGYDSTVLEALNTATINANIVVVKNNEDSSSNMIQPLLSNGLAPSITYSKTDGINIGSGTGSSSGGTYWITG